MSSWIAVHERGVALGKRRARVEYEELCWMEDALAVQAHVCAGYGGFGAYVEAVLGYDGRTARERIRVMERLRELPHVAEAWRAGEMLWGSVREVARVAVPETDAEWVEVARGKSGRTVQQMVSGLVPGDRPGAPKKAEAEDAVLRFEVKASTKALFVEAQRKLRRDSGRSLDDDELLLMMARTVLEGPTEAGRASYQVQMTVCEGCGTGWQQAGGEQVSVEPAAVGMALCDVQVVPSLERPAGPDAKRPAGPDAKRPTGPDAERPTGPDAERPTGPDAKRPTGPDAKRPTGPDAQRPTGPDAQRPTGPDAQRPTGPDAQRPAGAGDVLAPWNAGAVEAAFMRHGGGCAALPLGVGRKKTGEPVERATQRVPRRVRELVVRRDGGRCSVPGCANHAWLDVHHMEPTSDGGTNDPDLLCTLCGAHHRAAHEGRLVVSGRCSTGFRFTYADGSPMGRLPESPLIADKLQTARLLLRNLGFRLAEANDAVDRVRPSVGPEMGVEDVLRAALRTLA